MIIRDAHNIIVQRSWWSNQIDTPDDGGDSARSTGIMALAGSYTDAILLPLFVLDDGRVVRHPYDPKWSDPALTSRDQLIPVLAGLHAIKRYDLARKVFKAYAKRLFFINWDVLFIASIWHMVLCGRAYWLYFLGAIGYPYLFLSVLFYCWIRPWSEQNQFISMLYVAGRPWLWIYAKLHPDYKKAIRDYWSGWRRLEEIGELMIEKIENKLKE